MLETICFRKRGRCGKPVRQHDDVIKWKHFPCYLPFVWGIHRSLWSVFFDLRQNKRLSKQSWGWWFETPTNPLWRHCNEQAITWANVDSDLCRNMVSPGNIYPRVGPGPILTICTIPVLRDYAKNERCIYFIIFSMNSSGRGFKPIRNQMAAVYLRTKSSLHYWFWSCLCHIEHKIHYSNITASQQMSTFVI